MMHLLRLCGTPSFLGRLLPDSPGCHGRRLAFEAGEISFFTLYYLWLAMTDVLSTADLVLRAGHGGIAQGTCVISAFNG